MPSEETIYAELLTSFPCSLKETSKDDSEKDEPARFMTECQTSVVDFDAFKNSIAKQYKCNSPLSCDALYRDDENTWFLIEFKNGKLENTSKNDFQPDSGGFYDVIRKLFESLFLLTDRLGQTVKFTRENLTFILVYNEEKNARLAIQDNITRWGHDEDELPVSYLSKILADNRFNTS